MMKKTALTLLVLPFFIISYYAQENEKMPEFNLKQYYFVMLTKGDNSGRIDSVKAGRIIAGHLQNIKRMQSEGKLVIVGPFGDNGNRRGIFIFDVPKQEDVEKLLQNDPAIKAGMFTYEIHPWWSEKGQSLK